MFKEKSKSLDRTSNVRRSSSGLKIPEIFSWKGLFTRRNSASKIEQPTITTTKEESLTRSLSQPPNSPLSALAVPQNEVKKSVSNGNFAFRPTSLSRKQVKNVFNFETASSSDDSTPQNPTIAQKSILAPSLANASEQAQAGVVSVTVVAPPPTELPKNKVHPLRNMVARRSSVSSTSDAHNNFDMPMRRFRTFDPAVGSLRSSSKSRKFRKPVPNNITGIGNPVRSTSKVRSVTPPNRRSFFWVDEDEDDYIDVEDEDESENDDIERGKNKRSVDRKKSRMRRGSKNSQPIEFGLKMERETFRAEGDEDGAYGDDLVFGTPNSKLSEGLDLEKVKILISPTWTISEKLTQKAIISKIFHYDNPRAELTFNYDLLPPYTPSTTLVHKFSPEEDRYLLILLQETGIGTPDVYEIIHRNVKDVFRKSKHGEKCGRSSVDGIVIQLKNLSVEELKCRCEYLVRLVLAEDGFM
ncbi:hypothetical protein HK098_004732 [Nowakowskiella sp. JEL0407]|nr:hypothetical protein HK098_004732 [Nowakowskiella sp. JEL0407]